MAGMDYERLAFRHAPDATLVLSDRVILRASLRVEEVFGWSPRELEGQSIRLLYPGQTDYEVIGDRARRAMLASTVFRDERFMRRKDGQVIWMEGHGTALDRTDPQRLAIWTYRLIEAGQGEAAQGKAGQGKAGQGEAGQETQGTLTPTEKRIARYLVNGFTSKEIALALGSSPRTVEVHRANMIRKLQVRNSAGLVSRLLSAPQNA